jgi:hypothetical protein
MAARLPSSQNVMQLIVGVGQDLEQGDGRAGEGTHHHPGQDQHQDGLAAMHQRGDGIDEAHRGKAGGERQQLDTGHRQRQEDAEHSAQTGSRRDTQNIGGHQRVAEQGLVGGAGGGERRSRKRRGQHARQAHLEQDGLDLAPCRRTAQAPDECRRHVGERDRIGADERGDENQRGQHDSEAADHRQTAAGKGGDDAAQGAIPHWCVAAHGTSLGAQR